MKETLKHKERHFQFILLKTISHLLFCFRNVVGMVGVAGRKTKI